MVKAGVIGVGKMGISHLAILGAHTDVQLVGVADSSKLMLDPIKRFSGLACFTDYMQMINVAKPDAVVVAVPTKFHAAITKSLISRGIHVFVEKPFCLSPDEGRQLVEMAVQNKVFNQVGYHNKFVETFKEVKRIITSGSLGKIVHFVGEAYGPVVIRQKAETWRTRSVEGGGCLMDYASHVIDLINDLLAPVSSIQGAQLKSVYSSGVEDAVYSLMTLETGLTGVLSVNWSDETYRKMSTTVTIIGTKGKIVCDSSELRVFFKEPPAITKYEPGWNVRYITELAPSVDFYLRGEEYSSQMDYFIKGVQGLAPNDINTFESAWKTDYAIHLIRSSLN